MYNYNKEFIPEITETIQNWADDNNLECHVAYHPTLFRCHCSDKLLNYTFWTVPVQDMFFKQFFKNLGLKFEVSAFVLSILHELGHLQTSTWWSKVQSVRFDRIKKEIKGSVLKKETNYAYWNVADELAATKWAVKFINSNPTVVAALELKLRRYQR